MKKPEITLDARMIKYSGIGTYIKNMITSLVENFNLTLLGNYKTLTGFPWINNIKIVETNSTIYSLSEQIELPKKIPPSNLFISPHYNIPLLKIKALKRAVIIHDVNHLVNVNKLSLYKRMYARYMINSAIRMSHKIITVSEFSKNEIIKYTKLKGKNISIIYCGLNSSELRNKTDNKYLKTVREKYSLPRDYFLFVGNKKPHKNINIVINAIKFLSESFPGLKLVAVGITQDQLQKNREISINLTDKLITINYVEDDELPSLYKNARCLVFPSIYEGFGLPPLEAMICGCPVVASNAASIPEVCGNAALYFDPYNVDELVNNIKQIIENKDVRDRIILEGYKNIERFSQKKFSQNLRTEIQKIV